MVLILQTGENNVADAVSCHCEQSAEGPYSTQFSPAQFQLSVLDGKGGVGVIAETEKFNEKLINAGGNRADGRGS